MIESIFRTTGRSIAGFCAALLLAIFTAAPAAAGQAEAEALRQDSLAALSQLVAKDGAVAAVSEKAVAVLVFPKILKAGLLVGGAGGKGALLRGEEAVGYYSSLAVSYGLQAGAQTFGYALFFMNEDAIDYMDENDGWEVGAGPSVVVLEQGAATKFSSSMLGKDIYAVIFNQSGLMAGLGLEGSKISSYTP
ncbi:twin-arginine translocation pathway signal protein [Pikeienuella piscinae]|uniref:Twin-arginine translocation pathway signal protein n=1 Tax=Pikeienuella piscinae TaxID=2748098 RepID=A0A7L5C4S6_9RHOB|nr:YSC84-related protein [Pikeienuella piscinae]QIE56949.1 twin-arginine translocation pathway signal protein [Pikeienuella piscinae]